MASLELTLQRSASEHVSWPSGRALRMRSAERGRGRPTHLLWWAPGTSSTVCTLKSVLFLIFFIVYTIFLFPRRWKRMILSQRSGRTTLKRQCDLLGAQSVTMTFANMRCLLRRCSRAVASAASGMFWHFMFAQHFCFGVWYNDLIKVCCHFLLWWCTQTTFLLMMIWPDLYTWLSRVF